MPAMIMSKISSLPIDCPEDVKIKMCRTMIVADFFYMGMKLGLSHKGKKIG